MMQREPALDEAALLIYEYPDSAMAIVEKVEPRLAEEVGPEKVDSVSNTVFNYYRKHGSRREKFDMYYILGRWHQMNGREETAMFCYVSAAQYAEDAAGNVLPGCLYASMASLFEYGFDYAKAVQYYEKGAKYFIRSKDYRNFTDMCIKAARCCYHMGEEDRAETFIDKVEPYKRYVEESNKVRYFRLIVRRQDGGREGYHHILTSVRRIYIVQD